MVKAIVINPTEKPKVVEINGYHDLKLLIGGWLEVIAIGNDACAYIDEEGKIKANPPPINEIANLPGDYILGTMVIVGRPDRDGNDTDVPDHLVRRLVR